MKWISNSQHTAYSELLSPSQISTFAHF